MAVALLTQPGHVPGRDIQGGEQGRGAVTDVVVGALLGVTGLHRQRLLGPVQSLDLTLLVHAQHDRVVRGCQVETDHVGHLGLQFGIGGELERLRAPRPDPVLLPHLRHGRVIHAQPGSQQPARPVHHPQTLRWRSQGRGQDRGPIDLARTARTLLISQPCQTTSRRSGTATGSPSDATPRPDRRSHSSPHPRQPGARSGPAAPLPPTRSMSGSTSPAVPCRRLAMPNVPPSCSPHLIIPPKRKATSTTGH